MEFPQFHSEDWEREVNHKVGGFFHSLFVKNIDIFKVLKKKKHLFLWIPNSNHLKYVSVLARNLWQGKEMEVR